MKTILEPQKSIPVIEEADICILGGSCTGVFAAVRAAKLGARVVLVEKQNCFGGVATSGLVNIWHSLYDTEHKNQIVGGLTYEILEKLKKINAVCDKEKELGTNDHNAYFFNSEELKIELDKLVMENNIKAYLHTMYCAPIIEDERIKAIVIENKSGRSAILAKVFIDATGDGDLCRSAGVDYFLSPTTQPPTACAKLYGLKSIEGFNIQQAIYDHREEFDLRKDWGWSAFIPNMDKLSMHAEMHVFNVNCADADMLTYSEIEGRRQIRAYMDIIRKYAPNGTELSLADLCSYIGIRQTYQIKSLYQCKTDELLGGKKFEDAIVNGTYGVDIHHNADKEPGVTMRYLDGEERIYHGCNKPAEKTRWRDKTDINPTYYQIPYRSIVPNKFDNLIMCGRMIDAENTAFGAIRVMINTNQMGEAAGVAAYLSITENCRFKDVNTIKLQELLKDGGSIMI